MKRFRSTPKELRSFEISFLLLNTWQVVYNNIENKKIN
jgi:hypothetical protein